MAWLILGVVLWAGAHLFQRMAPEARATMSARMGKGAKGVFAVVLLVAVALMVVGYRAAGYTGLYVPAPWTVHVNNLLMLGAVGLVGVGHSKSRLRAYLRHPMLLGLVTWAVAHLLVNGSVKALILFGGLGLWAVVEILTINAREPEWQPWQGGSLKGDLRLAGIAVVLYAVIAAIHTWLGVWPFG